MPLQLVQRFFAVFGSFEGDCNAAMKLLEDPVETCACGEYIRQNACGRALPLLRLILVSAALSLRTGIVPD